MTTPPGFTNERKPMTPEEFRDRLTYLIQRMRMDSEFKQIGFFTRQNFGNIDVEFVRMIEPILGRKLEEKKG